MQNKFAIIGLIGRAHGLRGHFYIQGRNNLPLDKNLSASLFVGAEAEKLTVAKIIEQRRHSNGTVILIEGCQTRDQAESLRGQKLWISKEALVIDEHREYLWDDLIGKQVVDVYGKLVGQILQIDNFGATDVVRVKNDTDNSEYNMAFTAKFFNFNFSRSDKQIHMLVEKSYFA